MDGELVNQVIQNTRKLKAMENQRRSTIVRSYGEEHTADFVNNTATFYLPVDTDMQYMSELKFKLLAGSVGSSGTIDNPTGGSVAPGTATYTTMNAWLAAYPVGTYVNMDGYWGAQSLVPDTQILGVGGRYIPIQDLVEGDRTVPSVGKWKALNKVANNHATEEELVEVKTTDGYITGTYGHRVFVGGKAVELQNLKRGDIIDAPKYRGLRLNLTDDEYRFLGFWLGDGSYHKSSVFVTVGTKEKEEYLEKLDLSLKKRQHSNGKAWCYYLRSSDHPKLFSFIKQFADKRVPVLKQGAEAVIDGFMRADGTPHHRSTVITNTNKSLLCAIKDMAWNCGYQATLGKKIERERTNYCDHPKPIWRLSINRLPLRKKTQGEVLSVKKIGKGTVYHLNVWEGNHSYIAEGLAHHNCWDYADAFWVSQVNRTLQTGSHRSASDIWRESREVNAGTEFGTFSTKSLIKRGDWIVTSGSADAVGHIALAAEDYNGTDYLSCYGQNQGGTPIPQGGAAINCTDIPISAFVGGFRYAGWTTD